MTTKQDTANSRHFTASGPCLAGILLSLLLPLSAQAQDFGTLFTSPDEREYLDYLRQDFVNKSQSASFNIEEDVIPEIPVVEEPEPEAAEITQYKFGGIMIRLNGNRMVWLNGKQIGENELPASMSLVTTGAGTLLNIRANNRTYSLKPGQTINIQSGQVLDTFQSPQSAEPGDATAAPAATPAPVPETTTAQEPVPVASDASPVPDPAAGTPAEGRTYASLEEFREALGLQDEELTPEFIEAMEAAYQQANSGEAP